MITRLQIRGLAIIDDLTIEFSPGFNVITGETGAGKSILIKGLNFLMGGKATTDSVRQGFEQASVSGEFSVPAEHPALKILEDLGIPSDANESGFTILVRRNMTAKGRSQSWVNDVVVTSVPLRNIGIALVDIFGQHENQRLLNSTEHLNYIDAFLKDRSTLGRVHTLASEVESISNHIRELASTFSSREKNRDYLAFRLDTIENFDPTADDYEKQKSTCRSSEEFLSIRGNLSEAIQRLDGNDDELGIIKQAWELKKTLDSLNEKSKQPALAKFATNSEAIARELDDLSFELGKFLNQFEVDEGELESAQSRLFGYQELFRKHSADTIEALVSEKNRLKQELEFLNNASSAILEQLGALERSIQSLNEASLVLSGERKLAASTIETCVGRELADLAMPGARLEARFHPVLRNISPFNLSVFGEKAAKMGEHANDRQKYLSHSGLETGQFLLASNPGEPALPLARIASGGELSRIMLALKKTLAADAETCVLVFDEIDSGISGRVADVVGKKMAELSDRFQVICISHLPQVAVYANSHFLVQKRGKGDRTESTIVRLSDSESANEIARLLSGEKVTSSSLTHAKNLIKKARARTNHEGLLTQN